MIIRFFTLGKGMFTGIIEKTSFVMQVRKKGAEYELLIGNPFGNDVSEGDSIAVDGVCLTIVEFNSSSMLFFVSRSTVEKSIIAGYRTNTPVNLERAMKADGRFDGHIVQGHIDTKGTIASVRKINDGVEIMTSFDPQFSNLITARGSVCINGISLTTAEVSGSSFMVSLIPETLKRTTFSNTLSAGQSVNIEFDIIGKYVARLSGKSGSSSNLENLLGKL